MAGPRITRAYGAVNIGSFRISAMIMGQDENGAMVVLGSSHRKSEGVKRGYVTEMRAASLAIRQALEKAEASAGTSVSSVWIGCAGAGLSSHIASVEIAIGGRRIEEDDIEHLLYAARDHIQPDGRMVLHAQPAHYTLDGAHGVANPAGLHAEALGVDIHVTVAEGAPVRNLIEAVQTAHLDVEAVVASPLASAYACVTPEERELGVALIEIGAQVTNISVHSAGMLLGLKSIPIGSNDITDALASSFGIRRSQAERLKCVSGSAMASPTDHSEMIPVNAPGEEGEGPLARGADEHNRISRAELVAVVTDRLAHLTGEMHRALKDMGFTGSRGGQVVLAAARSFTGSRNSSRPRWADPCGSASRRASRACPKRTRHPASPRWWDCASMPRTIRSISARSIRAISRPAAIRGSVSSTGCSRRFGSISRHYCTNQPLVGRRLCGKGD